MEGGRNTVKNPAYWSVFKQSNMAFSLNILSSLIVDFEAIWWLDEVDLPGIAKNYKNSFFDIVIEDKKP